MTDETTESQTKKYSVKNKMREMIDNDSIWHFFIAVEMKAFGKGLFTGMLVILFSFFIFSAIF